MSKKKRTKEVIINTSSEIAGSVGGSIIGGLIAGLPGLIIGGAASPILSMTIKSVGEEISQRFLSKREDERISNTMLKIVERINKKLENGDEIRNDSFFNGNFEDRSSAEEILEGILLKAQREYQEKKIQFLGNLYCNLIFSSEWNNESANFFIKLIERLNFRQLCIIKFYSSIETLVDQEFFSKRNVKFSTFDARKEVNELNKEGILNFRGYGGDVYHQEVKSARPNHIEITEWGKEIYEIFGLEEIDNKLLLEVMDYTIEDINKLQQ